jgi:hypothetical protein
MCLPPPTWLVRVTVSRSMASTGRGQPLPQGSSTDRASKPAVVISSGGNDASGGAPTNQIVAELKAYIDSLQTDLPGVPIIYVCNWISPTVNDKLSVKNTRLQVNEQMKAYCESKENVYYLDTSAVTTWENTNVWLADRMHMNAAGYQQAAPLFLAQLDEIFGEETPEPTQPQTQAPQTQKPDLIPWICGGIMAAALVVLGVVLWKDPKKKTDGKSRD